MGGACSMYGGQERCMQNFEGHFRARDILEDPSVDGNIILK